MEDQTEPGMVLVAPSAIETGQQCQSKWRSFGPDTFVEWAEIDQALDPARRHQRRTTMPISTLTVLMDEIDE